MCSVQNAITTGPDEHREEESLSSFSPDRRESFFSSSSSCAVRPCPTRRREGNGVGDQEERPSARPMDDGVLLLGEEETKPSLKTAGWTTVFVSSFSPFLSLSIHFQCITLSGRDATGHKG